MKSRVHTWEPEECGVLVFAWSTGAKPSTWDMLTDKREALLDWGTSSAILSTAAVMLARTEVFAWAASEVAIVSAWRASSSVACVAEDS